jgi:rubrerythrin
LLDIEDERALGKLSQDDYEALRNQYERQALRAADELDSIEVVHDDTLEAEIEAMRERLQCFQCGSVLVPGEPCTRCAT